MNDHEIPLADLELNNENNRGATSGSSSAEIKIKLVKMAFL